MLRLLLPGFNVKRWLLVTLAGMVVFAAGFQLALTDQVDLSQFLWRAWGYLLHGTTPAWATAVVGGVLMVGGLVVVGQGMRRVVRSFTYLANPKATGRQLMEALLEQRRGLKLRVVGIGGGTGLSTLLRGLKSYPIDITAIVTVSDDGGSSGRLRDDLDMPPPGDVRACLVALAEAEPHMERLFQFRFGKHRGSLQGHSLGNLIIAGMLEMQGDFHEAIQEASRVLAVRGRVLPSTNQAIKLRATMVDGSVVEGETRIASHHGRIANITIAPPDVQPLPEVVEAIRDADVIIVGPGSVYSSLLPTLLIPGVAGALAASPAIKLFVCNVMTQPGESPDFSAAKHLEVVLDHLAGANPFHYAVVNTQRPAGEVLSAYVQQEQRVVEPDLDRIRALGSQPLTCELLADAHLARHDPDKLAKAIVERIARDTNWPAILRRRQ